MYNYSDCVVFFLLMLGLNLLRVWVVVSSRHKAKEKRDRKNKEAIKASKRYYYYYCKNGKKDRVINKIEVSKDMFDNYYLYHDRDIIHIGESVIWLSV